MLELLARNWWFITLRGVFAIIFGIMALAWPGLTIALLIIMFGAYAIVDGVFAIISAITGAAPNQRWWAEIFWGLLGIAAGIVAFTAPGVTALTLLYVIAIWAIVRGVVEIIAAIHLRKHIANEGLLILAGVCSILFGGLLLARPGSGAIAVLWLIGTASIVIGVVMVMFSLRLKKLKDRVGEVVAKVRET